MGMLYPYTTGAKGGRQYRVPSTSLIRGYRSNSTDAVRRVMPTRYSLHRNQRRAANNHAVANIVTGAEADFEFEDVDAGDVQRA